MINGTYLGFENAVRSSEIVGCFSGLGDGFCDIVFGGRDTCISHHLKAREGVIDVISRTTHERDDERETILKIGVILNWTKTRSKSWDRAEMGLKK